MRLSQDQIDVLHTGNCLACRTEARFGLKCWLLISAFKSDPETGMSTLNAPAEPWQYRLYHFGIPPDFDYYNYDIHPEYITGYANVVAYDIQRIEEAAIPVIDDLSKLADSRVCDCPL